MVPESALRGADGAKAPYIVAAFGGVQINKQPSS